MADHSKPTTTSLYTDFVTELDGRFDDISKGLDPATTTATNLITGSIRWNSASNKWQKYDGTNWNDLSANYAFTSISTTGLNNTGNTTLGDSSSDTVTINGTPTINAPTIINANSSTDGLRITQTGSGNALLVEDSTNPDASPFVIDANGRVNIGDAVSRNSFSITGKLQINTSSVFDGGLGAYSWSNDNNAQITVFNKSRGGVIGTQTIVQSNDTVCDLRFAGSDGTNFIETAKIQAQIDGTPGTNDMPGRLVFSTTADGASSPTERMRITNSGTVGIGGTPSSAMRFVVGGSQVLGVNPQAFLNQQTIQSDATGTATYYDTFVNLQATAFTSSVLNHYRATQGALSGGAVMTLQRGFSVEPSLIGATTNIGFSSNIPAGTNRWNFYSNGNASNFFAGQTLIGSTTAITDSSGVSRNLQVTGTSGATSAQYLGRYSNDANPPAINFGKSRGASVGTNTIVADNDILGRISFDGSDGTNLINGAIIQAQVDGTPSSNDMPTRLVFSTTADGTSAPTEKMRIRSDGNVSIGDSGNSAQSFRVGKAISGGTSAFSIVNQATIQSGVTSQAVYYYSGAITAASSFTVGSLRHYQADQNFIGAGSVISQQIGFIAESTMTGGTNNFGFFGNIPAGSGRWNFYAAGTANNYFAGSLGIGTTSLTDAVVKLGKNITGGSGFSNGLINVGSIQSDVTSRADIYSSFPATQATSFTLSSLNHYFASGLTIGAGSTVTTQSGFHASSSLTGATTNFGFYSNIPAGTGRWNFYAANTADNYFAGQVQLGAGSTSAPALSRFGDTNTGIYFPSADQIGFVQGGTEVMRVDSSSRLMVGLTTSVNNSRVETNSTGGVNGFAHTDTTASGSTSAAFRSYYVQGAGTGFNHFQALVNGGATEVCVIRGNGNIENANGSYGTISDIKIKENITNATPKLEDLMKIKVRNFNLKADPDLKQIGVIAQELEEIFPSLIYEVPDRDSEGNVLESSTKVVKTSVLTMIILKSLQELKQEFEEYKSLH